MLIVIDVFQVGQRERHSASLADLLRVGARPLALEASWRDGASNHQFDHQKWGLNQQSLDVFH